MAGVSPFSDFDVMWLAGRAVVAGENPYRYVLTAFHWPLHYPLPAVLVTLPFCLLPQVWAAAAWNAVGFGVLAYALTSRAWWPLLCLVTYPAVDTAQLSQWSAILTAIAVVPWLGFLSVAKPTTAGAVVLAFAHRTARRPALYWNAGIALSLIAVSFALRPAWITEWLMSVRGAYHFTPIVFRPGGFILLVALVRWRRPEARLLALMCVMPQSMAPYDAMALLLAIRTRREAIVAAWLSFASVPFLVTRVGTGAVFTAAVEHNAPILLITLYLPALIMILRRPNVADDAVRSSD